jgi:hypothetical protein
VAFLEPEIKVVRCLQPSTTELSTSIRKNGLPSYKLRDDIDTKEEFLLHPIDIYKNPLGLVIPQMYGIVLAEIEWTRKLIKAGKDPTIAMNENLLFIYWIQNSHHLIVDALFDFFKEYIDRLDYKRLDNLFVTTIFAYGASPLTSSFFAQYSCNLPELMFLQERIYENENDHMVDYMIDQATKTGHWSKLFVNKHPRITQIMIDFWSHPLDAFVDNISVDIARFKLANYLCTRPNSEAIALVKTMKFDEILDICSNPHADAVSYALENINVFFKEARFQMTCLYEHMISQAIQNSHTDMVDYVIANVDKCKGIFQSGKASVNTNPKMVSFLIENPSFIDMTLFLKNPAIIERTFC